ncbi:cytochrome P450 [Schizopora paradoxa]|uniref:Cytochrome P450 n=1 Tax=Schizopora paradoxa TaxID=27342 RepID=A0A0H2RDN4_9AGAM|nr:cytochrome P450 [Schizopora paradoxa]
MFDNLTVPPILAKSPYLALGFVVVFVAIGLLLRHHLANQSKVLPPGPRRLPIIGNVFDFPDGFEGTHWAAHKKLYGPLSSVQAFGKTFIIINDINVATDLLEKRSAKHSDRPDATFGGKMCGFDAVLSMQGPGEKWRSARRRIHNSIGTRAAVSQFNDLLELEGRRLALAFLDSPEKFVEHFQAYAGAIILKICFDYSISRNGHDPLVALGKEAMDVFVDSVSNLWIVDVIPALQYLPGWLPGMGFKKVAKQYHSVLYEFMERPFKFVKSRMAKSAAATSFVSSELESSSGSPEEEHEIKWTTAALYGGGADTSVAVMQTFILAMTLHPEVVRKAQAEIDSVIGADRLPQLSDRPSLPYLDAVIKETLRWNVAAPLSLPRATGEDDEYNGYFIPKGAVIFPNVWQMCHDPSLYHDSFAFKPERFLPSGGREPELDPRNFAFGFGRRICPGKELGDASLYVAFSTVLAVFNISKARDSAGRLTEPEVEYLPGVVSHPKKFQCSINPRSQGAVALIRTVMTESLYDQDDSAHLPESHIH